jgi:hypothetical protein
MAHRMRLTALITSEPLLEDADAPMGLTIGVIDFQQTVALDHYLCIDGLELLDPGPRRLEELGLRIDH